MVKKKDAKINVVEVIQWNDGLETINQKRYIETTLPRVANFKFSVGDEYISQKIEKQFLLLKGGKDAK